MAFIKVESEDVKIEEHEDIETQTGQFSFSYSNRVKQGKIYMKVTRDIFE